MADSLTGLSREVQEFVDSGFRDPFTAADLAARILEFQEGLPAGASLDEGTRTRLLVQLARTIDPKAPADPAAALVLLGATDDEDEEDEAPEPFIRGKWALDGAATLEEAAIKADELAASLRLMVDEGWTLREPVDNDYGWLVPPPGVVVSPGEPA